MHWQAIDFVLEEFPSWLGIARDVLSGGRLNASARLSAFLCSLASFLKVMCTYCRDWRHLIPTRGRRMSHAVEDAADNYKGVDSPGLNSRMRLSQNGTI